MPDIDSGGAKVARLYYCSGVSPLFVALAFALGVVVSSAWSLLLVLLGPRTPFETAVHSPQLVGLHFLDLAAALSSLSCAVASFNPSSARWRSSRLFTRTCGTPIPLFAHRRRSAVTNTVRRLGNVLRSDDLISHSLKYNGYNPDLCRLR